MIARRHILPRKPMIQARGFGVLNGRTGNATHERRRTFTNTAERRFRKPPQTPANRVSKVPASASIHMAVTHVHLSPHFNVLIRNHQRAQDRMAEQHRITAVSENVLSRLDTLVLAKKGFGIPNSIDGTTPLHRSLHAQLAPDLDWVMGRQFSKSALAQRDAAGPMKAKLTRPRQGARRVVLTGDVHPVAFRDADAAFVSMERVAARRIRVMRSSSIARHTSAPLHGHTYMDRLVTTVATRHAATLHASENLTNRSSRGSLEGSPNDRQPKGSARRRSRPQGEVRDAYHSVPTQDKHTPRNATEWFVPAPVPRDFRKDHEALPHTTAPVAPTPPTQPPRAPQIDIQQLDKVLWQRFEKRLRIETERRGRS